MVVWINRAGVCHEFEELFLKNNIIAIKWKDIEKDLSNIKNKEELKEVYIKEYGGDNRQIGTQVGQIWRFLKEMKKGDIVLVPLKNKKVLIAKIIGECIFNNEIPRHRRKIEILGHVSNEDYQKFTGKKLTYSGTVARLKNKNEKYISDEDILKLINF
jgi:predicted Mrr-cat superfamily restriction endonuclease